MIKTALASSLVLLAGAALAQDAAPPVSDEFVRLFSSYCLNKFPDDGALLKQAESDHLDALSPAQVVYVACDPVAFARDVALFAERGYTLAGLRAFDLFPNTHHVEAVARLVPAN